MPLVIVSGLPTSGKSTRSKQLYDYLEKRIVDSKYRLHLISDETLSISRTVYDLSPEKLPAHTRSANASEKDARAALYGAVKRVLSDKDIVILDGLNYIKGWRYQLHCEAKAVRTPSCILRIGCGVDRARGVNEERLRRREATGNKSADETEAATTDSPDVDTAEPYEPSNWDNLTTSRKPQKVFSDLWDAIAGEARKVVRPNQATVQRGREASGDYLYVLDRETSDIVKRIVEAQREGDDVDEVRIPSGSGDLTVQLPAGKKVGLPQLQRLRRAFMGLNRGGIGLEAVGDMRAARLRETFVTYLNDTFEKDE
ncbi:kti12, chromatin associated [Fusarium falciforme]|nr:kti12, chromatin associated [Fusarium falciforme]